MSAEEVFAAYASTKEIPVVPRAAHADYAHPYSAILLLRTGEDSAIPGKMELLLDALLDKGEDIRKINEGGLNIIWEMIFWYIYDREINGPEVFDVSFAFLEKSLGFSELTKMVNEPGHLELAPLDYMANHIDEYSESTIYHLGLALVKAGASLHNEYLGQTTFNRLTRVDSFYGSQLAEVANTFIAKLAAHKMSNEGVDRPRLRRL